MYQNKFTNNFGGRNRRPGYGQSRFGGRNNGRRNRSFESRIDVSMFIKKAEPFVKIEDIKY